jgi:hypothetical protein
MPRVGFEPAIPMFKWPKTVLALDHAAIWTGKVENVINKFTVNAQIVNQISAYNFCVNIWLHAAVVNKIFIYLYTLLEIGNVY